MYNFKKYSHNGDFISEIPQKFIKNIPTFHETINSGQWELSLEFSENISENFLKFWELVKIFYDWKIIYSWFVSRIEKNFSEKNSIVFYLIWLFDILRNFQTFWLPTYYKSIDKINKNTVNWKTKNFLKEMIDYLNITSNNFNFDERKILDLSSEKNDLIRWTFLDFLNHFLKNFSMNFHIWADWFLKIWEQNNFTLIFWKDISEIKIDTETSEIVNKAQFEIKYLLVGDWSSDNMVQYEYLEDEESIKKIWLKYKSLWSKHFWTILISELDKFNEKKQNYMREIFEKYKKPTLNIKLKIFDKKYFWVLKVLDTLTIKNFSEEIENKKIVKISYNSDYMEVELENFNSLWSLILWE